MRSRARRGAPPAPEELSVIKVGRGCDGREKPSDDSVEMARVAGSGLTTALPAASVEVAGTNPAYPGTPTVSGELRTFRRKYLSFLSAKPSGLNVMPTKWKLGSKPWIWMGTSMSYCVLPSPSLYAYFAPAVVLAPPSPIGNGAEQRMSILPFAPYV